MKEIFHSNGNQERAQVAPLISDKIDFKSKTVTRHKEGHNDNGINSSRICNDVMYTGITYEEHLN